MSDRGRRTACGWVEHVVAGLAALAGVPWDALSGPGSEDVVGDVDWDRELWELLAGE